MSQLIGEVARSTITKVVWKIEGMFAISMMI